jgi:hypothetical protein
MTRLYQRYDGPYEKSSWTRLTNAFQHVLDILAEMIALDQSGFKSSSRGPSAATEFDDDV